MASSAISQHSLGPKMINKGRALMEDDLWRKTNIDGTLNLMEDDLWWKTTPLMEDTLWGKTIFEGRQSLRKDNLWWKTTFDVRWPLKEDKLWWKTKFDRGCPLMEVEGDLLLKTIFHGRLHLTITDSRLPNYGHLLAAIFFALKQM